MSRDERGETTELQSAWRKERGERKKSKSKEIEKFERGEGEDLKGLKVVC